MIDVVVRIDTADCASLDLPRGSGIARQPRAARSTCHPTLTSVSPEMGRMSSYGVRPFMTTPDGASSGSSHFPYAGAID
jgi:hypothetical protein